MVAASKPAVIGCPVCTCNEAIALILKVKLKAIARSKWLQFNEGGEMSSCRL